MRVKWKKQHIELLIKLAMIWGHNPYQLSTFSEIGHRGNAINAMLFRLGLTQKVVDKLFIEHNTHDKRVAAAREIAKKNKWGKKYDEDRYIKKAKQPNPQYDTKVAPNAIQQTTSLKDAFIALIFWSVAINLVVLFLVKYWGGF